MIELNDNCLNFSFPEVHPGAKLTISFQRTLRIPDDGRTYPLPPGLGNFPLRHVDDYADRVPESWIEHGGVMLPMYQAEALWLNFRTAYVDRRGNYPFAIRLLTGKVDALTGAEFVPGFKRAPQNYAVAPQQPWIDGYCISKGIVRQFVAMPLGEGYTAEEQITGTGEHGGMQMIVYPMKRDRFEHYFKEKPIEPDFESRGFAHRLKSMKFAEMGIAPGGKIRQQIFADPFKLDDWDETHSRCFVHIANSQAWQQITMQRPPGKPPTAKQYTNAGLPWFDYYDDKLESLDAQEPLERLLSVNTLKTLWHGAKLSGNKSCEPKVVLPIRKGLTQNQVRESDL
jgi:hypothetical protein